MIIQTQQQLDILQKDLASDSTEIAIDFETNYTNNPKERFPVGLAIATSKDTYYIPLAHQCIIADLNLTFQGVIPPDLFSRQQSIIAHNAKFDIPIARRMGLDIREEQVECTMMMAYLINENPPHGLDDLGKKYFNIGKTGTEFIKEMAKAAGGYEKVPAIGMAKYAEQDAKLALALFHRLQDDFKEFRELWETVERPFLFVLDRMEQNGLIVDVAEAGSKSSQTFIRMEQIKQELGFDPQKTKQLHERLFSQPPVGLGLKPRLSPRGNPVTDSSYLKSVGHPITALVLEYRQCAKVKTAYYDPYIRFAGASRRIHPNFKPHGTVTGRLSCENPNFQQIPREQTNDVVKKLFLAEEDHELWEFDFKAIEYRLAAVYSEDQELINIFREEKDFHQEIANMLGISRHAAKTYNFASIYGAGPKKIAFLLGIPVSGAETIYKNYKSRVPALFAVAEKAEQTAYYNKGVVKLWDGHKRRFTYPGEYKDAFNSVIQGGAFAIVKRSMLRLDQAGYKIVNQVHDSIWVQLPKPVCPDHLEKIHAILEDWTEDLFDLRFTTDQKKLAG